MRSDHPGSASLLLTASFFAFLGILSGAGCGREATVPDADKLAAQAPGAKPVADPALAACLDNFAGAYEASMPMATHPGATAEIVLALQRDWRAQMTTSYFGTRHPKKLEQGTWRCDRGKASVFLSVSSTSPERTELAFEWKDDTLVSTRFDAREYGPQGLRMRRQGAK
jgi:hypothetical protein